MLNGVQVVFKKIIKLLALEGQEPQVVKQPETYQIDLVPNKKYRLKRQMYLFPSQAVTPKVNDYLRIGAIVSYLKSGEIFQDNNVLSPWVYVRSEKGTEGWCFSHYLQMADAPGAGQRAY
ncbi:MAG: SH3 domain-containing protein [Treponema sp.]|jgi:hypothetical protein|nr:SH3 domain-containing protein [Treponema sp.]